MKTANTELLDFKTKTVIELTEAQVSSIYGGATTFTCGECVSIPTFTVR